MLYLMKQMEKWKRYLIVIGLLCILLPFASVLTADAMGALTEHFTRQGMTSAGPLIGMTALLYLAECMAEFLFQYSEGRLQAYVYSAMQQRSFRQLAALPVDDPLMGSSGDLYNRISNDTNEITAFLSTTMPEILMQTATIAIALIYLLMTDWRITLIYFSAVLCSVTAQCLISLIMKRAGKKVKASEVAMNIRVKDFLRGRMVIKSCDAYSYAQEQFEESSRALAKARVRLGFLTLPLRTVGILCGMVPVLSVCMAGLYMIPARLLDVGSFLSVFYLCQKIVPKQLHYVELIVSGAKTRPAAERVAEFWKAEIPEGIEQAAAAEAPAMEESGNTAGNDCGGCDASGSGGIILQDVWYRYPKKEDWAVQGVSLEIAPGKKVAFTGESGSGKSTVLKLISGLIAPQQGVVKAEGAVINGQFPHLFTGTIRENISFGDPKAGDISDSDLDGLLRTAALARPGDSFDRSGGIDGSDSLDGNGGTGCAPETMVSGNGGNLSGGQRQRIAIARTLHSGGQVLLFDESVSALDNETAKTVVQNILEHAGSAAVVMVLHQKELLPLFDEVYTFEGGKLRHEER